MTSRQLLVADDDTAFRDRLCLSLQRRGWDVRGVGSIAEATALIAQWVPAFALLDLRMGNDNGIDLIAPLKERNPDIRIVVLTGYGSIATALDAVRQGAADYRTKPADTEQIEALLLGRTQSAESEPSVPSLDRVEWEHLQRVLADCGGNVTQAARLLGIDRRSLQRKIARFPPPR